MKKIILSLLAVLLLLSCNSYEKKKAGTEVETAPYSESLSTRYRNYDNGKKPGYGIMVLKDGEIEHAAGYGMADLENKKPITPKTKFHSWLVFDYAVKITVLNLWEKGKIDLDAPITSYLTYLPVEYSSIKVDHLVSKTSGIAELNETKLKGEYTAKQVIEMVVESPRFKYEPGTSSGWAGGIIELLFLDQIIKSVTGEEAADYINTNVFKKLGLDNTQSYLHAQYDDNGMFYYKRRAKKFLPITHDGWYVLGLSTTISNMEDIALFFDAIDNKKFVSEKVYKKYTDPSKLNNGSDALDEENKFKEYFDGYFTPAGYKSVPKKEGISGIGYGGDDQGSAFYPEDGYRIFVVSNLPDGKSMDAIFQKVQPAVFPKEN